MNSARAAMMMLAVALLCGCATRAPAPVLYDFGPVYLGAAMPATPRLPALSVAEVQAPPMLDGPLMFYRLGYANIQQPQPYAASRWSMTPAQLLGQRLKTRIAQEGGTVLSQVGGASQLPLVRLELDDFIQIFSDPGHSVGQLSVRASVLSGPQLIAQRQFSHQVNSPAADAAGGARALATASDAVITEMLAWLAGLPLKK
jgi:cholesterol transport system auxiliary component